jgi:hypothetical protein
MKVWSFREGEFSLTQKIRLRIAHRVKKKSGAALTKFIWSTAASQAMRLMIGIRPNANSKRSLVSQKIGIVVSSSVALIQEMKSDIRRMETMERTNQWRR